MPPTATALSPLWPRTARLDADDELVLGGVRVRDLAAEFGTPAYLVDEDDLRARARAFADGFRRRAGEDALVVFATKAFPCPAILRVLADEGLGADVASAGELRLALAAGVDPSRIVVHGNAKTGADLRAALDARVAYVVIDSLDEVDALERLATAPQDVLLRVTPGVAGETHAHVSTGQADSKFGLNLDDARAAIDRLDGHATLRLRGLHLHIGSQILELDPFVEAIAQLAPLGDFPVVDVGGGLGVGYRPGHDVVPSVEAYVEAKVAAVERHLGRDKRILDEPGRAVCALSGVTAYEVQSVKRNVSTWVAVDGGMSDNLRPMLYDAPFDAQVVGRPGGDTACRLVGKHCESGDELIRDARLADPRAGDLVVTPATGAYCYAMSSRYNGQPRPPVVLVRDGDARLGARRETLDDLLATDVPS